MKISGSTVAMNATRSYQKVSSMRFSQVTKSLKRSGSNDNAASMSISDPSRKLLQRIEKERKEKEEAAANKSDGDIFISPVKEDIKNSEDELQLKVLREIIKSLRRLSEKGLSASENGNRVGIDILGILNAKDNRAEITMPKVRQISLPIRIRETTAVSYVSEQENTTFDATGIVKTADGREIGFNINVEMSRSFEQSFVSVTQEEIKANFCDPLVINIDTDMAAVSDRKFFFDIDNDGEKESISELSSGCGYLALDRNGDGTINDGGELFGTASGDGFRDLSQLDSDGNNWIDENDTVFSKLRIWTKDSEGNDKLYTLAETGVGALYLGNADTGFSLNSMESNETNAAIRKTGIYLRESGEVGTMQHVDLAL